MLFWKRPLYNVIFNILEPSVSKKNHISLKHFVFVLMSSRELWISYIQRKRRMGRRWEAKGLQNTSSSSSSCLSQKIRGNTPSKGKHTIHLLTHYPGRRASKLLPRRDISDWTQNCTFWSYIQKAGFQIFQNTETEKQNSQTYLLFGCVINPKFGNVLQQFTNQ